MPLKQHQNSSYSNLSPEEKYTSEKTYWVDLILHDKIKKEIDSVDLWRGEAIINRSKEIKDFVCNYFSIDFKEGKNNSNFL